MTDLVNLMSKLVTPSGKILIPGVIDSVSVLTDEEKARYTGLEFNMSDFHDAVGASNSIYSNEVDTLMARSRYPSLSLHGIEGAFSASGAKTVIPAKVIGKFSIRTVPDQEPTKITQLVVDYVNAEFAKLGSKNKVKVECLSSGKWWYSSIENFNYVAGARAIEKVFKQKPDYTREGGSIPVTLTFAECLKKSVMLLPMGAWLVYLFFSL